MPQTTYQKIGQIFLKEGLVSQDQLDKAILLQQKEGGRLGEILVRMGLLTEQDVVVSLAKQLNLPYASLGTGLLRPAADQGLEKLIPKNFTLKNLVLPLSRHMNSLTCAFFDPLDLVLIDNLKKMTSCEISPVVAARSDIIRAIEEFYGKSELLKEAVKESYGTGEEGIVVEGLEETLSLDKLVARAEEAPVVKLVDLIIRQAIDERASDIHIEPLRDRISLRYRIDGKLVEIPPPAKHLHLPIISRIKILSHLDIAEKRLPQDGAFTVRLEDRAIDLRISFIPLIYGEKVVMRILDRAQAVLDLGKLGFNQKQLEDFRKSIDTPYGVVLLTGPTGSGKTTTLYAALNELKDPQTNIVTVEDPVEYKLDGINQLQVKPEIGLTFASALRAFLRQDPDIMLVGEIRDLETAEICIRSALTGHLVLSTLHTNDAPSAINRLMDIGIEPYLITPSLICIVAQRLIRKLCSKCKEAYEPTKEQLGGIKLKTSLIYRAKGCAECNQLGYKGRSVVAEVLVVNDRIRDLISQRASFMKIRDVAKECGMQTLYESGLEKVEQGISSLEEVLAVTIGGE
ncbi:MAG: ATPase, T2SS/T4P/T4SS family [Candidatus Omnitrophota bacterium]